ncbi:MAG TPA: metalloregulator ArsR/SmtB family transcription factor [Sorangium sp.]|nr:metalloregulator ArsR/SmtB family transcription factor [Sorangium sp.]
MVAASGGRPTEPRWALYRLLADPTRLRLLALAAREELAVSELAELLRLTQPKVSRHAAALREAGLLLARKHGTWVLLRLAREAPDDAVVNDALKTGTALCEHDGIMARIPALLNARDVNTREFFARGGQPLKPGPPAELAAYLHAMAPMLSAGALAIDVGTGDGALLEVLAPLYTQVVAVDRSQAQLALAAQRTTQRGFENVSFVCGEVDSEQVAQCVRQAARSHHCGDGADAVFAARILHHAPVPAKALAAITKLAASPTDGRPGGCVLVLDYDHHDDQRLREQQADLWLGFAREQLFEMAQQAGLNNIRYGRTPAIWRGDGPDSHLAWHWLSCRRAA